MCTQGSMFTGCDCIIWMSYHNYVTSLKLLKKQTHVKWHFISVIGQTMGSLNPRIRGEDFVLGWCQLINSRCRLFESRSTPVAAQYRKYLITCSFDLFCISSRISWAQYASGDSVIQSLTKVVPDRGAPVMKKRSNDII